MIILKSIIIITFGCGVQRRASARGSASYYINTKYIKICSLCLLNRAGQVHSGGLLRALRNFANVR